MAKQVRCNLLYNKMDPVYYKQQSNNNKDLSCMFKT